MGGVIPSRITANPRTSDGGSVAVEATLAEAVVGDPEVVSDLVDDGAPHRLAKGLVAAVVGLEGGAEQRDPVGKGEGVAGPAIGQRHPLVQAQQARPAGRGPVLDQHVHVLHAFRHPLGQGVQGLDDE